MVFEKTGEVGLVVAAERWLFPQEVCPGTFIYLTCLRHPVGRIKSSVKFHTKQTKETKSLQHTKDFLDKISSLQALDLIARTIDILGNLGILEDMGFKLEATVSE